MPHDRDARQMAAQIRAAVDTHGIEEIAFLNMPAFFGLTMYLDVRVESVRLGGPERPHSRRIASADELCAELGERERNLYALKRAREGRFTTAIAACGPYQVRQIGSFRGDGHDISLFDVRLAAPGG
jgi:hypothetical protein